jgi:hypothetical protein
MELLQLQLSGGLDRMMMGMNFEQIPRNPDAAPRCVRSRKRFVRA